ncbi:hypothetical protein GA830_10330 [Mesorhizobium sp. NBSH29]|uniref:hypothetical protein n=1 Tax=Mesorhizobium sp. NBSH29 TaxID=2654249 RepID=UPI0018968F09|nr:hypothetical protein [Mesorhizobium sp. NBSH29]QPC87092.1 hypothetical protein GA830_10330 [Mesorhizobium sp. NBSH29]
MDLKTQLLHVADRFGELTNRSRARVSSMVLNQGQRLDRYSDGSLSPSVKSFERAMVWFSSNWPAGQVWPANISRPPVNPIVEAPAVHDAGAAVGAVVEMAQE